MTYNWRSDTEPKARVPYCNIQNGKIWVGVNILPNTPTNWTLSVFSSMPLSLSSLSRGMNYTFPTPLQSGIRMIAIDPPPNWQTAAPIAGLAKWNLITVSTTHTHTLIELNGIIACVCDCDT